jgi:hypothetical protein
MEQSAMKEYQLNGVNVHEGMYLRAENEIGNGKKVFLTEFLCVVEAPTSAKNTHCLNCDGAGRLGLEVVVGGPYQDATDKKHVIWHEGKYYAHELVVFVCPDCNGSGLFARQTAGAAGMQL